MKPPPPEPARSRVFESVRRVPFLLYALLLVCAAYAPLARARWVGSDWPVLDSALGALSSPVAPPVEAAAVPSRASWPEAEPLARFSLQALVRVLAPAEGWTSEEAWRLRLVQLCLLAIAGIGVQRFVRRGLQPWTGAEQARAAAGAAALLFVLHPLCVSSVARLASHGDLLALALSTGACAAFLHGRQERSASRMVLALLLCFLAGATSARAWFLPVALAVLEYTSARRHRPRTLRLRTALTTLLVFGVTLPLERALHGLVFEASASPLLALAPAASGFAVATACAEKLGVLLLPVNTEGISAPLGYTLAAAFLVLALQPAFVAARSAPRLWGRILLGWLVCVLLYQVPDAALRAQPSELAGAHFLLVPALLAAIGFGIASTALFGPGRVLVPLCLALPYAMLARSNALPFVEAGERVHALQRVLLGAARAHPDATLVAVDLPDRVRGLDACEPALGSLLAPELLGREGRELARHSSPRSLDLEGFFVLVRQPEMVGERARGLVLVLPARLVGQSGEDEHFWVRLPPADGGDGRVFWRKESSAPAGVSFDPLVSRSVRVKSVPGTEPVREPALRWLARSARFSAGERLGTWLEGEDAPIACFDLSRDLGWLLGERVSSLWFPGALISITSAEVTAEPNSFDGGPPRLGESGAWTFDLGDWQRPQPLSGEGYWVLDLLELGRWKHVELSALLHEGRTLEVPDAAAAVQALLEGGRSSVAWCLEWRVAGVALARASGRIEPEDLSLLRE